jgi:hypothetical protein
VVTSVLTQQIISSSNSADALNTFCTSSEDRIDTEAMSAVTSVKYTYPDSRKEPAPQDFHGVSLPDSYKWLEDPQSEAVKVRFYPSHPVFYHFWIYFLRKFLSSGSEFHPGDFWSQTLDRTKSAASHCDSFM